MKRLEHVLLELEEWNRRATCDFCSGFRNKNNKAVCQIRTRKKATGELITNACVCEDCKEKFESDELLKCNRCERLQTESNLDVRSNKYVCDCIRYKEDLEEKELPVLPRQRESMSAFYERQISKLQNDLVATEEELEIEREEVEKFQEKSEEWNKRQKQELLDKIKDLEAEVERLKKLTPQELVNKLTVYEEEIKQLTAQIEVKETKKWPWKLKK